MRGSTKGECQVRNPALVISVLVLFEIIFRYHTCNRPIVHISCTLAICEDVEFDVII